MRWAALRFSRESFRPRYSRHRTPRYWNATSNRPWSLSSLAKWITSSQNHCFERHPVNHNLAPSVMHAVAARDLAHADPVIEGLGRKPRSSRRLDHCKVLMIGDRRVGWSAAPVVARVLRSLHVRNSFEVESVDEPRRAVERLTLRLRLRNAHGYSGWVARSEPVRARHPFGWHCESNWLLGWHAANSPATTPLPPRNNPTTLLHPVSRAYNHFTGTRYIELVQYCTVQKMHEYQYLSR